MTTLWAQANVALFIFGLMAIAGVAEESGVIVLVARYAVARGKGSSKRLFTVLFLSGATLTALLSNDATAVLFTPVVYRAVTSRGLPAMPFLFACTFVANTASFGLPFANPANVLVLPRPDLGSYLEHLALPQLAAIAVNLAVFAFLFRSQLTGRYAAPEQIEEAEHPAARRTLAVAALVAAAYAVALVYKVPLGPVALLGAGVMLVTAGARPREVLRHIAWRTFALLAVLFFVVDELAGAGVFAWALAALDAAFRNGALAGVAAAAGGSAFFSALLNNLPVAVVCQYLSVHVHEPASYGLIAGVDLGPNLLPIGSMSSILWLGALRKRGVAVDHAAYVRLGALVVPPMLAVTVLWLWLVR
ncbi:MAG: SLC13 family permease [Candidatus Tyrphobacter sp.]